eukprot:COSAG01_NODE_131_length_24907_cov_19.802201_19_plen_202_part_00
MTCICTRVYPHSGSTVILVPPKLCRSLLKLTEHQKWLESCVCVTYLRVSSHASSSITPHKLNCTQRRRRGKITISLFVIVHRHSGAKATMASHRGGGGSTVGVPWGWRWISNAGCPHAQKGASTRQHTLRDPATTVRWLRMAVAAPAQHYSSTRTRGGSNSSSSSSSSHSAWQPARDSHICSKTATGAARKAVASSAVGSS